MNLLLNEVSAENEDLLRLIDELDTYLYAQYPPEEVFTLDLTSEAVTETLFVVAYYNGEAVGCGAIRPIEENAVELKRFYVNPQHRNLGIASEMIHYLEHKALTKAYYSVRLETGPKQPESLQFYEKHGYKLIERYGEYIHNESSMCYEKKLKLV